MNNKFAIIAAAGLILFGCNKNQQTNAENDNQEMSQKPMHEIKVTDFGKTSSGENASLYTLVNSNGLEVSITNYGGIVTKVIAPDKKGNMEDVVLGYDSLQGYLDSSPYFGALVGRYGNRIAAGQFELGGVEYTLAVNNGENHLHGGKVGFDKKLWKAKVMEGENTLSLSYTSQDMEEGYPGTLKVNVVYTLTDEDELKIDYSATTDKTTVVNLTNHTYFNLTGNTKGNILDHEVMIKADHFLPVDETLIPTGELRPVEGTPFDFTEMTRVGERIGETNEQLKFGGGYDHCWVFTDSSKQIKEVARVYEPKSGREVIVSTDQPAIQFYSGNFLNGTITGKYGSTYEKRYGLCLETEHYPDSPNQDSFPSTVLEPGDKYSTTTIYTFTTDKQ